MSKPIKRLGLKIDVHGCTLDDAIYEIIEKLEESVETGNSILEVIHGYKHNTIIRDYIRSTKFIERMSQQGLGITVVNIFDLGKTILRLKANSYKPGGNVPISKYVKKKEVNTKSLFCDHCNSKLVSLKGIQYYYCPSCKKYKKH